MMELKYRHELRNEDDLFLGLLSTFKEYTGPDLNPKIKSIIVPASKVNIDLSTTNFKMICRKKELTPSIVELHSKYYNNRNEYIYLVLDRTSCKMRGILVPESKNNTGNEGLLFTVYMLPNDMEGASSQDTSAPAPNMSRQESKSQSFGDSQPKDVPATSPSSQGSPTDVSNTDITMSHQSPVSTGDTATATKDHYNTRNEEENQNSNIFHMRKLNNWLKGCLIDFACICMNPVINHRISDRKGSGGLEVLDLGCGKGGDYFKWMSTQYNTVKRLVGVDIADKSLEDYFNRIKNTQDETLRNKYQSCIRMLINANLSEDSLSQPLPTLQWTRGFDFAWEKKVPLNCNTDCFDIVSCQFAMHYFFQTRSNALHFFKEISTYLHPGGLYISTTIDARALLDLAHRLITGPKGGIKPPGREYPIAELVIDKESQTRTIRIRGEEGSILLDVVFRKEHWDRFTNYRENASKGCFGIEYSFNLFDTSRTAAVFAAEWIVPQGQELNDILEKNDMEFVMIKNFHEYFKEMESNPSNRASLQKRMNIHGTIGDAEWEIFRLYMVFVASKKVTKEFQLPQQRPVNVTTATTTTMKSKLPHPLTSLFDTASDPPFQAIFNHVASAIIPIAPKSPISRNEDVVPPEFYTDGRYYDKPQISHIEDTPEVTPPAMLEPKSPTSQQSKPKQQVRRSAISANRNEKLSIRPPSGGHSPRGSIVTDNEMEHPIEGPRTPPGSPPSDHQNDLPLRGKRPRSPEVPPPIGPPLSPTEGQTKRPRPCTPPGQPPTSQPRSPPGQPPTSQPRSPPGQPPTSQPRSPPGQPPTSQPRSPPGQPPTSQPRSPPGQPPALQRPRTPPGQPPALQRPRSPEAPPPENSPRGRPRSPVAQPPGPIGAPPTGVQRPRSPGAPPPGRPRSPGVPPPGPIGAPPTGVQRPRSPGAPPPGRPRSPPGQPSGLPSAGIQRPRSPGVPPPESTPRDRPRSPLGVPPGPQPAGIKRPRSPGAPPPESTLRDRPRSPLGVPPGPAGAPPAPSIAAPVLRKKPSTAEIFAKARELVGEDIWKGLEDDDRTKWFKEAKKILSENV